MRTPWEHLTSRGRLVSFTREVFDQTGGGAKFTTPELECIDGKLGAAWTAELYVEDEHKIEGFAFAAHLMFNIIRGHCLVDGNKRLAWISLVDVLASLGWEINASIDDAESFCLSLCEHEGSTARDVQEWLLDGRLKTWQR
jgi:death on curing protein